MKVLITSVPAGSGHVRAAEALLESFQRNSPAIEAAHIQVTDLVTPGFRKLYVDGYRVTVNHAPSLWGRVYRFWDNRPSDGAWTPLLHQAQRYCSTGFYDYLENFRPDLILTTHFLVPQLLAAHPSRSFRPVIESVITDYDVHRFWVSDNVSRYYVAHENMIEALGRYGVPPARVVASGIPVHPCFSDAVSPSSIFNDLQLNPRRPVILMLAGGMGLNPLKAAVEKLFSLPDEVQIITVAGKNESLRTQLDALRPPPSIRLLNLGYVRNMHELLTLSNVVITKPGGLTVSECLAKKKLMILFSPIPGQEEKNAEFLVAHKAAVKADTIDDLPRIAAPLLSSRSVRGAILWNVERCSRPDAAFTITNTIARTSCIAA